jgi:aromatic-L-amino-acid decarboxylase
MAHKNESKTDPGRDPAATDEPAAGERNSIGDLDIREFRELAHRFVDWISDYLISNEKYPVLSQVKPGYLKNSLPAHAPLRGESLSDILTEIDRLIVPGVTHWNHPAFFAYFATSSSGPGILGEMLSAAFNVNAMLWRTSPAATELEEVTLEWLRGLIGLSADFSGVVYDTASISTLCAIAAAREAVDEIPIREEGLAAHAGMRLRMYASEHAHSSVDKAAIMLGIGQAGLRKIPADSQFRMDPAILERAITEDRANGWRPFCVVATVGTTSTTSIDPVTEVAEICDREKLWLHVDAAYGGSAACLPEMKWLLDGCDRADSLVMNPHKWLFVPVDLSVLFTRRMEILQKAFSLVPEFLRSSSSEDVTNFMNYGPQLGRRFRALKLWLVMKYFGQEGLASRIRNHIAMAREFAQWVDDSPDFERLAPVPLSLVCFRAHPHQPATSGIDTEAYLNALNERLLEEVNRGGRVFLSHTKLRDTYTLRLAIGNLRTTLDHVRLAWNELTQTLSRIQKDDESSR